MSDPLADVIQNLKDRFPGEEVPSIIIAAAVRAHIAAVLDAEEERFPGAAPVTLNRLRATLLGTEEGK